MQAKHLGTVPIFAPSPPLPYPLQLTSTVYSLVHQRLECFTIISEGGGGSSKRVVNRENVLVL